MQSKSWPVMCLNIKKQQLQFDRQSFIWVVLLIYDIILLNFGCIILVENSNILSILEKKLCDYKINMTIQP